MKILRLIARMNIGGPAVQICGLMKGLSEAKFDQKLLTGTCKKNEADYLEFFGESFDYERIEGFGRSVSLLSDLKSFFRIRRLIKFFSPDLIHTHTAKAGLIGRLSAMSVSRKIILVHTYHGHLLVGYFNAFIVRVLIWIERVLARRTKVLVAVGSNVRDDLLAVSIGFPSQYKVIPPGVDIGKLTDRVTALNMLKIPPEFFIISWLGRVEPIKAPHRILDIAEECMKRRLKTHFVIAGDGTELDELRSRSSELNLPITFLGWHSEVESLLSCSNLVILTSENEGTPVALIQAQMAGVPVLSVDVGSAKEVLLNERSGFCLTYSKETFVDKIQYLIENPIICSEFGAAGKQFATENFSVERLVMRHEELYEELFNQSRSSPRSPT